MQSAARTRVLTPGPDAIAEAAAALRDGALVAFPTETVYGLGADAGNAGAIARLYAAKGRPRFNPLIVHVADTGAARSLGIFNDDAEKLAATFWPGPLTLVLRQQPNCGVAAIATAGLETIAIRVPAHPVAQDLLRAFGGPVVAPSANKSGHVSPTLPTHVLADLDGAIDYVLAAGATAVGVESTIVGCLGSEPELLRPGGLSRETIERALGRPVRHAAQMHTDAPSAPGQLESHYAPHNVTLRLNATCVEPGEGLIAFGTPLPHGEDVGPILNLSESGNLEEAACRLFSCLRAIEGWGRTVAVMPVPEQGLGEAINDRLRRAAAPTRCMPAANALE